MITNFHAKYFAHDLIGVDTKSCTLLKALELGFETLTTIGAARKAIIFTESRRTQEHLKTFLESSGYQGEVVLFNGTNSGPEATAIYQRWAWQLKMWDYESGTVAARPGDLLSRDRWHTVGLMS